jgi:hypothetical protein
MPSNVKLSDCGSKLQMQKTTTGSLERALCPGRLLDGGAPWLSEMVTTLYRRPGYKRASPRRNYQGLTLSLIYLNNGDRIKGHPLAKSVQWTMTKIKSTRWY